MSTKQEDEQGWPPEFAALVQRIRSEQGDFSFRFKDEEKQLYACVELPVPGATGMAVYAGATLKEDHGVLELVEATTKAYHACKSKLLTMNPPPMPVEIPDDDFLKEMGILWTS